MFKSAQTASKPNQPNNTTDGWLMEKTTIRRERIGLGTGPIRTKPIRGQP